MALAKCQLTITDASGNIVNGASVEVRNEIGGAPLAVLYSDRDGAVPLGNPYTAADGGDAGFFADDGEYRITATLGAFTRTWRYVPVFLSPSRRLFYREVTAAGDVTVVAADDVVGINKAVGAATGVGMPPAADRSGLPVTIKDVKGDAETNNITITFDGAETCDGLSSIVIGTAYGWVTLYPRTGGYFMG